MLTAPHIFESSGQEVIDTLRVVLGRAAPTTDQPTPEPEAEELTAHTARRRTKRRPPRGPLSQEERADIRKVGAEDARRSRLRQGLLERIEDPAATAVIAELPCAACRARIRGAPSNESKLAR